MLVIPSCLPQSGYHARRGSMPIASSDLQIKFLRIARIGFEDDLELVMLLQAVGILAIAAVIRADGWFHISHIPGLRAQHA